MIVFLNYQKCVYKTFKPDLQIFTFQISNATVLHIPTPTGANPDADMISIGHAFSISQNHL